MLRQVLPVLALTSTAFAQEFIDRFNYPVGTVVPGYSEQRGDWMVLGTNAVQANVASTFQELTNDTFTDADCCVEATAIYDTAAPQLMYIGPLARHTGAGSGANYFMIKLQDNGAPRDGFDTYWVYFYNGASFQFVASGSNGAITPPTLQARVRLQVIEEGANVRVQIFIDTDMDGKWNITNEWMSTLGIGTSGMVGINGYRNAIADDFKYFNGTLYLADRPVIGTAARLLGRGTPNTPFQGVCSLGNSTGIPLSASRAIPVDLDPLLILSLSTPTVFAFSGITSATGDFTMTFNIPALASLSGLTVWGSAFTFSTAPFGFIDIMPDTEINIVSS
jgi:hypothetical protein